MTFRFAPSPNGHLHLGHAYSALLNHRMASEAGEPCLLRIEDIDATRCTPELEADLLDDLRWIGFEWDGEIWRQSDRYPAYQDALRTLRERELVYPAFLSRSEVRKLTFSDTWPRDPDGAPLYPGHERSLHREEQERRILASERHAWRLDMRKAVEREPRLDLDSVWGRPLDWGDPVLARSDAPTSYHLSVVLDDAAQGVTHVVRGRDLERATAVHVLLQRLFGLPTPRYTHHELILDDGGRKLSKSAGSPSLRSLRAEGWTPEQVRERLGFS